MASIDCVVDTQPMASEINSVSKHVAGTTTAVVGMRAAVIQAEEQAAEHVCQNVNRGFYSLIHSQISQKIAKLRSEVDSHFMQLNQQRKQLVAIKSRMERDYGMISARYIKLFNGLNKNLLHRVTELDRPVLDFAVRDVNVISNRTRQLPATVPVSQLESLTLSQKILASNVKHRGEMVIESMHNFLCDMQHQKELTDRILLNERAQVDRPVMIPVVVTEANYDRHGNTSTEIIFNEKAMNSGSTTYIKQAFNAINSELRWSKAGLDKNITNEFNRCLAQSSASPRVKDMISTMFANSDTKPLKR